MKQLSVSSLDIGNKEPEKQIVPSSENGKKGNSFKFFFLLCSYYNLPSELEHSYENSNCYVCVNNKMLMYLL